MYTRYTYVYVYIYIYIMWVMDDNRQRVIDVHA